MSDSMRAASTGVYTPQLNTLLIISQVRSHGDSCHASIMNTITINKIIALRHLYTVRCRPLVVVMGSIKTYIDYSKVTPSSDYNYGSAI